MIHFLRSKLLHRKFKSNTATPIAPVASVFASNSLYIDSTAEMVIVLFASHPVAANLANNAASLPAY